MKSINKYRGCLIGGAAGDALGYPVEFLQDYNIFQKYGENGITEYDFTNGVAQISDDTQMTLFTASGLVIGEKSDATLNNPYSYVPYIYLSYKDWYKTQTLTYPLAKGSFNSWLADCPELFSQRAPGTTCLNSLGSNYMGTQNEPINRSKGCGGVMRVAPIGLYFDCNSTPINIIDNIGADAAAITHGHELGYIPAAALVHIISVISHSDEISLSEAVLDMQKSISELYRNSNYIDDFNSLIDKAIALSKEEYDDLDAIRELGQGWVAEETIAIAIYCSLKYSNDFDKALIAAVNHSGDSDSTGAITGNILGAYLGLDKIPNKYLQSLELKDTIIKIADDLAANQ